MEPIEIRFNGKEAQVTSSNVLELLNEFQLSGQKIAVELNSQIISRHVYESTKISPGDKIEIVQFVGGG